MKRMISGIIASLLIAGSAHAALLSRAGGQAYFDSGLDITWLADANYAQTMLYDNDGWLTWHEAQSWIDSLNAEADGVGHLGVNDWRLPNTVQPDASCSQQFFGQSSGGGCSGSEMGHLYYVDGIESLTPGPFTRVEATGYWSGTPVEDDPGRAWRFSFKSGSGIQDHVGKTDVLHAWAVRSGDISQVPAPGAAWLLGTGLVMLGARASMIRRPPKLRLYA
jgi:hypothetical protein